MAEPADFETYNALLNSGNRTEAYVVYAQDLAALGEYGGYHQVMMMAQISSYSGELGGAAALGNLFAAMDNEDYNISLDQFSEDVARKLFDAVEMEAGDGKSPNGGNYNDAEIRAVAYDAWADKKLEAQFPGNYQRENDREDGYVNVEFGPKVLKKYFENDPANYQGDETGIAANLLRGPTVARLSRETGNFPDEYGFTEEQLADVRGGGEAVTLANGLTLSFQEVLRPDGTRLDSYTAVHTHEGKMLNLISDYNDDYFRTGGRIINDTNETEYARYGLNLDEDQAMMAFSQNRFSRMETRNEIRRHVRNEFPDGLPPRIDSGEELLADMRELTGDQIKNVLGADVGEYGVRRIGTDIQPFPGLEGRPGYDRAGIESFQSRIRKDLELSVPEARDMLVGNLAGARAELDEMRANGTLDEHSACVADGIDSAFAATLYAELEVAEVPNVTIPYGTNLSGPLDKVDAALTAGAVAFEAKDLSVDVAQDRFCEMTDAAMDAHITQQLSPPAQNTDQEYDLSID